MTARADLWFAGITAMAAWLRFSRLGDYHNPYYTAAVASMLQDPHNFLFASFDPLGLVTVDKPPLSLWVQALPAAFFGVTPFTVALPQTVVGIMSVALLYRVVRPAFGRGAALTAAAVLAVLPVSVVMESRNEPDAVVSFLLLLSAVVLIRAVATGRLAWILLFGVLVGLAFNAKMLVAFMPLPAFAAYAIVRARLRPRFLVGASAAALALATVSLSWIVLVASTPQQSRPYIGSTDDNSIWTLVLEYNGLNRFGSFIAPVRPNDALPQGQPSAAQGQPPPGAAVGPGSQYNAPGTQPAPQGVPQTGLLALFDAPLAAQLGWLLPLGLFCLLASLVPLLPAHVYKAPTQWLDHFHASLSASQSLLWCGWLATGLVAFSLAPATITHPYYLEGVAVPLAAVIGIGVDLLWRSYQHGTPWQIAFPAVLVAATVLEVLFARQFVEPWVVSGAIVLATASAIILVVGIVQRVTSSPLALGAATMFLASLALIPLATSPRLGGALVGNVLGRPVGQDGPLSAGVQGGRQAGPPLEGERAPRLRDHLTSSAEGQAAVVGTMSAREASPLILSGIRAVAVGGFSGRDPIVGTRPFREFAQQWDIQYFLLSNDGPPGPGAPGPGGAQQPLPVVQEVRRTWEDVSGQAGFPPGTLYHVPHGSTAGP